MKMVRLATMLLLFFSLFRIAAQEKISITNGYFHEGALSDQIVFYFSEQPICNYIPSKNAVTKENEVVPIAENGLVELEFFMPVTTLGTRQVQKFVEQLNAVNNDMYRIHVMTAKNKMGLVCYVAFRPDEIGFQYESFQAVTGKPALSFSFVKRKIMQDLNRSSRPLLRSAQLKKKRA